MTESEQRHLEKLLCNCRRVDADTIEVRTFTLWMGFKWVFWCVFLIVSMLSVLDMGKRSIERGEWVMDGGLLSYLVEDVKWVVCPECQIEEKYAAYYREQMDKQTHPEKYLPHAIQPAKSRAEFQADELLSARVTLFWHALPLIPLFWPNARGVRFDRRRRLVYGWWNRTLFAVPVFPGEYPLAGLIDPVVPFNTISYLWKITLYRERCRHMVFGESLQRLLGVFPPVSRSQSNDLVYLMGDFMITPDPSWLGLIKEHPRRHWHWLGRLFNFPLLPVRAFPKAERLNPALAEYELWWWGLSQEKRTTWLTQVQENGSKYLMKQRRKPGEFIWQPKNFK